LSLQPSRIKLPKTPGQGKLEFCSPDCLKSTVPRSIEDVVFADCNQSGSLSADAKTELFSSAEWADGVLLIGDAGRNSETAIVYEEFISHYNGPLTITRDAIDLVKNNPKLLIERSDTLIIASFAQVQKLFQSVYYPKMLTFNMQLLQLVEALHKFTITYSCTIVTLHKDTMIIASGGKVVTQEWTNPMAIWRGSVATRAATYWLWNPSSPLKSTTASAVTTA
jgi:NAD(P)H-hydrate repair Nnr-like enzyme with NAD(P)H-hydrate dehydratase domain